MFPPSGNDPTQLLKFVLAADADRYEEIVAAHPKWAEGMPARVRGSEARRFKAMRDGRELKSALAKKRR